MGQQSIAHKISYLQTMADQFLILISGTVQAEEMFINRADIQTVLARQFSESCHGLVWFGSARV